MEFFTTERVSPSTTAITDITGVHSYLVEGEKEAVLIDSGTGAGDLKAFVQSLTKLPVSVILTHGHCDHAGGDAGFEKVFLNEKDWDLARHHATIEQKKDYVSFCLGGLPENMTEADFCPVRTKEYLPLEDGQEFDLGGVVLKIIAVPGHTQGMSCVLNVTERTILFGDACNPSVFLWANEASSVEEYRETLLELKKREGDYDKVYLSHGPKLIGKEILDGVILVCEDILSGNSDEVPFEFMGYEDLLMAKKPAGAGERADGGLGNIIYNSRRIFRS